MIGVNPLKERVQTLLARVAYKEGTGFFVSIKADDIVLLQHWQTVGPEGRCDRRKLANICEATMMRVVELEREAASLIEIAKKLRAAVVANT